MNKIFTLIVLALVAVGGVGCKTTSPWAAILGSMVVPRTISSSSRSGEWVQRYEPGTGHPLESPPPATVDTVHLSNRGW